MVKQWSRSITCMWLHFSSEERVRCPWTLNGGIIIASVVWRERWTENSLTRRQERVWFENAHITHFRYYRFRRIEKPRRFLGRFIFFFILRVSHFSWCHACSWNKFGSQREKSRRLLLSNLFSSGRLKHLWSFLFGVRLRSISRRILVLLQKFSRGLSKVCGRGYECRDFYAGRWADLEMANRSFGMAEMVFILVARLCLEDLLRVDCAQGDNYWKIWSEVIASGLGVIVTYVIRIHENRVRLPASRPTMVRYAVKFSGKLDASIKISGMGF